MPLPSQKPWKDLGTTALPSNHKDGRVERGGGEIPARPPLPPPDRPMLRTGGKAKRGGGRTLSTGAATQMERSSPLPSLRPLLGATPRWLVHSGVATALVAAHQAWVEFDWGGGCLRRLTGGPQVSESVPVPESPPIWSSERLPSRFLAYSLSYP